MPLQAWWPGENGASRSGAFAPNCLRRHCRRERMTYILAPHEANRAAGYVKGNDIRPRLEGLHALPVLMRCIKRSAA